MLGDFPLTQSQTIDFNASDGSPLRIFVEAGGIEGRPRMVRVLRKGGAAICTDPKEAQVILVDSRSNQGRQFVREWSMEGGKVVLQYSWVQMCITAGKALTEQEQWGGCVLTGDTFPPESDEESDADDNVVQSPLPTPRETPAVETKLSVANKNAAAAPGPPVTKINEADSPPVQQPMPEANCALPNPLAPNNETPQLQVQFQQHPPNSMLPYFTPPQPDPNAMIQVPQHFLASLLNQQNALQNSQATANSAFSMALLDAMRFHGMTPNSIWPPTQQSLMQPLSVSQPIAPTFQSQEPAPSTSKVESVQSTDVVLTPQPITPLSQSRQSKSVNESNSPSPPLSLMLKGKQKATLHTHKPTPDVERPHLPTSPSASRKIFTSETGIGLTFFVQVDLHNRFNTVNTIKKNGGIMTTNNTDADYTILYSHSKVYTDLLRSTLAAGGYPVSAAFVHECVRQGYIVDMDQYLFGVPTKPRPRKRKRNAESVSTGANDDEAASVSTEIEASRGKKSKRERQPESTQRQRKSEEPSTVANKRHTSIHPTATMHGERSPTPPPASTHVYMERSDKYRFTDEEIAYAIKYTKLLLSRDHNISMLSIASAVHKKLPQHSLNSWKGRLSSMSELGGLRKKAGIAYRKAQRQQESLNHGGGDVVVQPHNKSGTGHPSLAPPVQKTNMGKKEVIEKDMEFIVDFLVNGGDEDGPDDSVLFEQMTTMANCLSAASWQEFFFQHSAEVDRRYRQLTEDGSTT